MSDIEKTSAPKKTRGKRIGKEQIEKARGKLEIYKAAKAPLNETIKYNEQWFRRRFMEYFKSDDTYSGNKNKKKRGEDVNPASAWLFNSIMNYHSDAVDSQPKANVLPRESGDELEAAKISMILPSLMDRIGFEKTYDDNQYTKGIQGWSVYSTGWDKDANNGKGEIYAKRVKLLNLYWDQEVDDLQDSSDVFYLHQKDKDELIRDYPAVEKELSTDDDGYERQDENPNNSDRGKATVVDWYYKKKNKAGRKVVHYVQFCGTVVLYATENDKELAERGLYDHGEYPFEVDVLYPLEGQVAGFGKVAVGAPTQMYIDLISKALVQNALWSSSPRYMSKEGSGINESDFLDVNKKIVRYNGMPDELVPVQTNRIDGNVLNLQSAMIDEMRTNTGSTEVSTGSTPGGVTAAQAIVSLQEAAGKQGRASNRASWRCFRRIVLKIIELMRQFYTEQHYFRVTGDDGEMAYVGMDNRGLTTGTRINPESGMEETYERHPLFDLEITAEKSSPYSRLANNELYLSFYNAGFFNAQRVQEALACVQLMDFDGKEKLIRMLNENQQTQEQKKILCNALIQYAGVIDELNANRGVQTNYTQQTQAVVQQVLSGGGAPAVGGAEMPSVGVGESTATKKAREKAASAAAPV